MHDVYAYGVIAPSTLIELIDDFPSPSGYAEMRDVHTSIGGEAASTAYVLARLGVATKLSGNRLSASSMQAIELLEGAGVDCSSVTMTEAQSVGEVVVSHHDGRTIFGTYRRLLAEQAWDEPSPEDIRAARIVCADPFFGDASVAAGRSCREFDIPCVTVDTAPDSEMAALADVLLLSEEYVSGLMSTEDPAAVLTAYTERTTGWVILTRGAGTIWSGQGDGEPVEYSPVRVEARDTTGAGDSFRAGVIYGMLHEQTGAALIRTAAAVAALVCQTSPGVINSPTEEELRSFLAASP